MSSSPNDRHDDHTHEQAMPVMHKKCQQPGGAQASSSANETLSYLIRDRASGLLITVIVLSTIVSCRDVNDSAGARATLGGHATPDNAVGNGDVPLKRLRFKRRGELGSHAVDRGEDNSAKSPPGPIDVGRRARSVGVQTVTNTNTGPDETARLRFGNALREYLRSLPAGNQVVDDYESGEQAELLPPPIGKQVKN